MNDIKLGMRLNNLPKLDAINVMCKAHTFHILTYNLELKVPQQHVSHSGFILIKI